MNRTVQKITKKLLDLLPENDQYYRLDDLYSWGFPPFIVQRIKIELERNLAESMVIPKTDWANIQSDGVQDAWQQFVSAIRAEARLPASYGKTVIETAVADVVEMLVQPRKNIPEVIFSTSDSLSYDEVIDRAKAVVVYRHLASLLPRYMQKKELETISRQKAEKIVSKADYKITARYSPLNWAQMLEPLFKLLDGTIDSDLLRLFFEDKNLPRFARQFDLMDDSLSRARLIEALSSPEALNFEGYEDDQANLFGVPPISESEDEESLVNKFSSEVEAGEEEPEPEVFEAEPEEIESLEEEEFESLQEEDGDLEIDQPLVAADEDADEEEVEEDHSLNAGFIEQDEEEEFAEIDEEKEDDEDDSSLNAIFSKLEESNGEEKEKKMPEELPRLRSQSINQPEEPEPESTEEEVDTAEVEAETEPDELEPEPEKDPEPVKVDFNTSGNGSEIPDEEENGEEKEETPMWMRYMSDEEVAEYQRKQKKEATEEENPVDAGEVEDDEDGFIEEPIIDHTKEDVPEEEIEQLHNQLTDDRSYFVEEIFGGSDRAFDEAVEEIAGHDQWRDVSKFIEKDVFKRNMVDMYSEAAVDFTDRLQSYFLEKQNRNS